MKNQNSTMPEDYEKLISLTLKTRNSKKPSRMLLTNLRFADDVMLFATSKEQIRKMMCDFKKATEKVGLRIHPDKTKILSNQSSINSNTKKTY